MTKTELRQRILRALNEDVDAPTYWQLSEIDDYLEDAQEFLAEHGTQLFRTVTIPRLEGRAFYFLEGIGDNLMVPLRIWLPDLQRRLTAWSLTDLDRRHAQWLTVTGDPWVWAPIDWRHFVIWPIPATGGGWLELHCAVWPESLPFATSRPEFFPADHEALAWYGELLGRLKQRDAQGALSIAQRLMQRWGNARIRGTIEQLTSAFHVKERAGDDNRDTPR